jgi:maleylpyruvate isomerase
MIDDDVAGVAHAHQRLLARLDPDDDGGLSTIDTTRPSHLPGWSVGHVLAHLTHHAWSLVRLFEGADEGAIGKQYPGGPDERALHIERDADVPANEHVSRLREAIYALEGTWSRATRAWEGRAEVVSGAIVPIADLPLRRWREVEVHMGDLGIVELGFDGPQCWSDAYVRRDVRVLTMQWTARGSMGMNTLPTAVARLEDRWRLAWLLGRFDVSGVGQAEIL